MPQLPTREYAEEWEDVQVQRFNSILGRNLGTLLREASTEFNFLEIKPKLEYVIDQVKIMAKDFSFWSQLSDSKRTIVNSSLDDMIVQFDQMDSFDPKQNNAWDIRNNIVQDFNTRYNAFYDNLVSPLGAYLGKKAYSEELAGEFGRQAEKELAEIRRVKKEIEKVQVDVKDAAEVAGNIASTAHGVSFADQAKEHAVSAKKWLLSLLAISSVALAIALTVVYDIIQELKSKDFTANTEAYIIKVAILAFLYIGIRFTIKNYSAHQHLYIVNKQRSNILTSMEAFRTSALEGPAKDSILLAAVGAAFAQQETGFITTKEGAGSDDGDIMDIVRTALKK
jgi:hypothetical protein